jgi:hypothetical protein
LTAVAATRFMLQAKAEQCCIILLSATIIASRIIASRHHMLKIAFTAITKRA